MNKTLNCEFYLNSEEEVSFSNDIINIELVEKENNENIITAECDTKKDNTKSVKCNIKKDDKTEINNEYSFKEQIVFDSKQYIVIIPEEDISKIYCEKKESKKKLIITAIVIVVALIIIVSIIIVCICSCKKKKNIRKNNNQFPRKLPEKIQEKTNREIMPNSDAQSDFTIDESK